MMVYNRGRYLFYDLDTKTTFSVSEEQWNDAEREYERQCCSFKAPGRIRLYVSPCFSIRTETGTHYRWIFREDQDYCKDHIRGIR